MNSNLKEIRISTLHKRYESNISTPTELKAQIDAILQNDFAVLNSNPSVSHHSLLTMHNNPLLLNYVKNIYKEYKIKDPLNKNSVSKVKTQPDCQLQLKTQVKRKKSKLHLYSSLALNKFSSPLRQQNTNDCQHLKTEPKKKYLSLGPSSNSKDQIQNELTIKKQIQKERTFKASSYYFDLNYTQQSFINGYNQASTFIQPDRINLSFSKQEKGKEIRIEVEQPFESIDEGVQVNQFYIPLAPNLPTQFINDSSLQDLDAKMTITEPRTLVLKNESFSKKHDFSAQNLIQGAYVAQSRLMMPYPLPQIIKINSAQFKQINQSFRYCIGCQRALLEANINIHQKTCVLFKKILASTPKQVIQHLKSKIYKFEANIKQYSDQLLRIDPNQLEKHYQNMLEESRSILGDGRVTKNYEREYRQVLQISKKWCLMTEQINKVNWFLKIRQRVKKQMQI